MYTDSFSQFFGEIDFICHGHPLWCILDYFSWKSFKENYLLAKICQGRKFLPVLGQQLSIWKNDRNLCNHVIL